MNIRKVKGLLKKVKENRINPEMKVGERRQELEIWREMLFLQFEFMYIYMYACSYLFNF